MTLNERADCYRQRFPDYPCVWIDKGWLMGVWLMGQLYKRTDATIYGGYPGNYLRRLLALFPEMRPARTLHLFAGNTPKHIGGTRVDLDVRRRPSCVADARHLPFRPSSYDFVIADPPYSSNDAVRYGFPMISRRHVMHEVRSVVAPGGYLAWLDTVRPMYRREDWTQFGAVAVLVSTNTRTRLLSLFRAEADEKPKDARRDWPQQLALDVEAERVEER